jgi:hypothetical protein
MLTKTFAKFTLAAAIAVMSMSPTFAAKMTTPKPCANPQLRCTGTCDKDHWCKVYMCSFNRSVEAPFPCNEQAGGCLQPHC